MFIFFFWLSSIQEEKSSCRFEDEVVAGHLCNARYPTNLAYRSVDFTPSHLQHSVSMTANAAAVPGLVVISATTEYLTNNYRILKRHLKFMVDPPGSKHTHTPHGRKRNEEAASFSGYFFFLFSRLETRFARKTTVSYEGA